LTVNTRGQPFQFVTTSELLLLVAVILFGVAGCVQVAARSITGALVPFGLVFFALAFLII